MGLWYRTKTFKKIDIIKVKVETEFNINTQTRYTHWDEPEFCITYAHYKGKLRVTNSVCYIQGSYPTYKVRVGNLTYVDLNSEVYVLIFEKDSGYYNKALETPDYSKEWNKVYTLQTLTSHTLDSSNDFTLILPKEPSKVLFFPTFKYLNIPLGMMGYYFDIQKVNNHSWKIIPKINYASHWDTHIYRNERNINLDFYDSSNLIVYGLYGLVYTTTNTLDIKLNVDGVTHMDKVEQNEFLQMASNLNFYCGVVPRQYALYTNGIQNRKSNLKITYTGGTGLTTINTIVRVLRKGDDYLPYLDCSLEVLVLWVG